MIEYLRTTGARSGGYSTGRQNGGCLTVNAERTAGVPAFSMRAPMLTVFAVSVGYGVVLPVLPRIAR